MKLEQTVGNLTVRLEGNGSEIPSDQQVIADILTTLLTYTREVSDEFGVEYKIEVVKCYRQKDIRTENEG